MFSILPRFFWNHVDKNIATPNVILKLPRFWLFLEKRGQYQNQNKNILDGKSINLRNSS